MKRRIKWSYACRHVPNLPEEVDAVDDPRVGRAGEAPRPHDVVLAEVLEIGRHKGVELREGRRATLWPGDLVGLVYGDRYATRQYEGVVGQEEGEIHILSVGGACGRVVGAPPRFAEPTRLRPVGYLLDAAGERVRLLDHGLSKRDARPAPGSVIVVVGSNMDAGKTTTVFSIIRGLVTGGRRVVAAKLTGVASMKDGLSFVDAGADLVLDFSDAGLVSTAGASREQLVAASTAILTELAHREPDFVVLEIADSFTQRESTMLLDWLRDEGLADHLVYAAGDTLAVAGGVTRLRDAGHPVSAVSGRVTITPLGTSEARAVTDAPVLAAIELQQPGRLEALLGSASAGAGLPARPPEVALAGSDADVEE